MSEPANLPAAEKPVPGRVRRWLWRWTRRGLIGAGVLVAAYLLFCAEENWRGERQWNANKAQLEQRGEKLDVLSLLPPMVPDEQNFAAAPLLVAACNTARDHEVGKAQPELVIDGNFTNYPSRHWLEGQTVDLLAWQKYYQDFTNLTALTKGTNSAEIVLRVVDRYAGTFAQLREYSQRPKVHFQIKYDPQKPLNTPWRHFGMVKYTIMTLNLRVNALLALGRIEEAGRDMDLMLRLADTLKGERYLISWLVRRAVLLSVCQPVWDGMVHHQWTEAQLQRWQRALSELDVADEFLAAVREERAAAVQEIRLMMNDPDIMAKGLDPDGVAKIFLRMTGIDVPENDTPVYMAKTLPWLMPKGWIRMEQVHYAAGIQEDILDPLKGQLRVGQPSVKALRKLKDSFEDAYTPIRFSQRVLQHRLVAFNTLPVFGSFFLKAAYTQSLVQMAATACALERQRLRAGAYPASLEMLAPDIQNDFTGRSSRWESLLYHPEEGGRYLLYSAGWDGLDDGGKVIPSSEIVDSIDGDWVWPQPVEAAANAGK